MTACERLKMAEDRISHGQWKKWALKIESAEGTHYCLVGALCTDAELEQHGRDGLVLIPGLKEAYEALGFRDGHAAYTWNDRESTKQDDVLNRVIDAREKVCPKKEE